MNSIKKSIGANFVTLAITILDRLIIIPILAYFTTSTILSGWILLRTIPGYLTSADFGIANETGNNLTKLVQRRKFKAASINISTSKALLNSITVAIIFTLTIWNLMVGAEWISKLANTSYIESILAVTFITYYAIAISHTQLFNAVYRSVNKDYVGILITNLIRVFEILLFLLAMIFFKSIAIGACAYFIARFTGNIFLNIKINKSHEWAKPKIKTINKKLFYKQIKPSLAFVAYPASLAFSQQAPIAIVSSFDGITAGASFAAMLTISRIATQIGLSINRSIWPTLARINSEKLSNRNENSADYWKTYDISLGGTILSIILVGLFTGVIGYEHFDTWSNNQLEFNGQIFFLLIISACINSIFCVSSTALMARSKHKELAKFLISITFASIGIQIIACLSIKFVNAAVLLSYIGLIFETIALIYLSKIIAKERNISIYFLFINAINTTLKLIYLRVRKK